MKTKLTLGICGVLLSLNAAAGQMCGKQRVADNVRTCPNGDIPMFVADEVRPYTPPQPAIERSDQRQNRAAEAAANAGNLDYYFGVWRTRIPGAVWTSPSGYQGYDWLHVSAGVSAGDLIIKPNGTYVWASYGGKSGRWTRSGDAGYPIVLIDTVENRQWRVGIDPKHTGGRDIIVWDGGSFYYDGRK
jgi:hypothetical protein